jgi:hypothetical protein
MMGSGKWPRMRIALGAVMAVSMAAAAGAGNKLSALGRLEPGLWQLRDLDDAKASQQSLCVGDPLSLVQLRHRGAPCTRLVVSDADRNAVIHYTCPASGYGQTAVRVETPRLAQIDTQGILDNRPFAFRAEARRIGSCDKSARR